MPYPASLCQQLLHSPLVVRRCIKTIAPGTWFDKFILILIIANSITMGLTDYSVVEADSNTPSGGGKDGYKIGSDFTSTTDSSVNKFVEMIELPFLILFTIEMITKMIALGFWGAPNTYVRDPWNKLDLLVVFVGWFTVVLDSIDPELLPINLGVLRAFRVLRPLRSIARLPGLRRVIQSLVNSAQGLLDLVILVTFALLIFSILGMQLFQGKMHSRCRLTPFPVRLDPTCTSNETNNFRTLDCWSSYIDSVTKDPELWRCRDPSGNLMTTLDADIKDKSSSPWATPTDCIWPEDEDDTTLCADDGSLQKHTCAVDVNKNMTCGSNFDPYGNSRFVDELFPYGFNRMKSGTWNEVRFAISFF